MKAEQFSPEFLHEMIVQLDAIIPELESKEKAIAQALGSFRVAELKEYWDQILTPEEERELKRTLDFRDRELLWVWSRLIRAVASRAEAGKTCMRHLSPKAQDNSPKAQDNGQSSLEQG